MKPGYTGDSLPASSRRYGRHLQRPHTSPGSEQDTNYWWLVVTAILYGIASFIIIFALFTLAAVQEIIARIRRAVRS